MNPSNEIATKCSKCGGAFVAGQSISGNEAKTYHSSCPTPSNLEDKELLFKLLGEYKVIGDTTFGLGYKEAEKLVAQILSHYIPKADILKALGEEEKIPYREHREDNHYTCGRNNLRSQIKKELGLE